MAPSPLQEASNNSAREYRLCKELKGLKGAVNALIFSKDRKLLLGGGDDGCVRVWNTEDFKCEQVLHSNQWGQVTTLSWVSEAQNDGGGASICIGTGRGVVSLCPMSERSSWFLWKNVATFSTFDFNDAIETQAYDELNQRLAIGSHSGRIKMFGVEKSVSLVLIWEADIKNAIPRSLTFFGGANQSLLIHGLETGEMCCRDAQNSNLLWTKTLAGAIGHATLSPDESTLIVDNLSTGQFDVYAFPASTPASTFPMTSTRRFIKHCVFAEDAKLAICGSDAGSVEIIEVATACRLQLLRRDGERSLIQAVTASTLDSGKHLVAAGSAAAIPTVYVWEKKRPSIRTNYNVPPLEVTPLTVPYAREVKRNIWLVFLILLVSYPNWSTCFWNSIATTSAAVAHGASMLANFSGRSDLEAGRGNIVVHGGVNVADEVIGNAPRDQVTQPQAIVAAAVAAYEEEIPVATVMYKFEARKEEAEFAESTYSVARPALLVT